MQQSKPVKAIAFDMYGVLYDGVHFNVELLALVKSLKPRYKIGLLSNISKGRLDGLLSDPHMAGLFNATLASSETSYSKPHPELFEQIAERLDVEPSEMLFIDDSEDNVSGAAALRIAAHQFRDNERLAAWLRQQDVTVTNTF